jgi:prevent-host-death family protein
MEMSDTWNVHKAKTHLSTLIDRALRGEEVVISRANRPVARLVALAPAVRRRTPGLGAATGYWMSADFDEPLPESFWLGTRPRRRRAPGAGTRRRNGSK